MSNVKSMPNQHQAFVVDLLREFLAAAEAGELSSCVVIAMKPGGVVSGSWGGQFSFHEKVGLLEQMKHSMFEALTEVGS